MSKGKNICRLSKIETEIVHRFAGELGRKKLPSNRQLIAAGRQGVMKARRNYRPSKGDFSKYAGWWIRNSMKLCVLRKLK